MGVSPKSVLMTTDTVGGVWTYSVELAGALAAHGIKVYLAAMGGSPSRSQREQLAGFSNIQMFESNYRLEWMPEPWNDVRRAGDWLLGIEACCNPALIHLNNYAHGDLNWSAPVVVVGHSCVLSWWEAVHRTPAPPEWNTYAARLRQGLRAARMVAAPSHAMLAALNSHYGPLRETAVIPNGRDARLFEPADKAPFVLAAGRLWDEAKNISALTGIACEIPWPIRLAGEAAEPAEHENVEYLGQLSQHAVAKQMAQAGIYALPARYEPFGLSVLEAALSGCALVLGDIPSLRENWSDAALFVNPDCPENLRHAITLLIEDDSLRSRLANAARHRAASFTPERMLGGYLNTYRALLAAPRMKACV